MDKNPKKTLFDTRFAILVILQSVILLILALQFLLPGPKNKQGAELREVGSQLQAAGVLEEALRYYERYLDLGLGTAQERANLAVSIAALQEQLGRPERALSWYYLAQVSDAKSDSGTEARKKIVSLLESLGKVNAAKQAMKHSTTLGEQAPLQGGVVLAKVGDTTIYQHQLNETIDALPKQLQKNFQGKEGKVNLLQKLVADQVLFEKAQRLGLENDPAIQKKLHELRKQALVQRVIEQDVTSKVSIDGSDLKNFFEANRQKFVIPAQVDTSFIKVKSKATAQSIAKTIAQKPSSIAELVSAHSLDEASKSQKGRVGWITEAQGVGGLSGSVLAPVFKTKKGKVAQLILSDGFYYVFFVHDTKSEQRPGFDQIKEQVAELYKMEKIQGRYQQLVQEALKGEKVQLFAERIK